MRNKRWIYIIGIVALVAIIIAVTLGGKVIMTLIPSLTPKYVSVNSPDDVLMVEVSGGEFVMGSSPTSASYSYREWDMYNTSPRAVGFSKFTPYFWGEIPRLTISLPTFAIDQVQATNVRYKRCMEAGVCTEPVKTEPTIEGIDLPEDYFEQSTYDDYPVSVSWEQAVTYCEWVGKRLPTEAEWEKSARSDDERRWPWGNAWDEERVTMTIGPVGEHPEGSSPYGVLDMIGNLPEWTLGDYELYPGNILKDDGFYDGTKIVRGGKLAADERGVDSTTSVRLGRDPQTFSAGFRCVKDAKSAPLSEVVLVSEPIIITPTPPTAVDLSNMVLIPEGEFMMGAPDEWVQEDPERRQSEAPQHAVYLDAYYIDQYEVTNGEYAAFLNVLGSRVMACAGYTCVAVRHKEDENTALSDRRLVEYLISPNTYTYRAAEGYERYPVERVSWYGAQAYCAWKGKRLPTEAEWEKAARGTDGRRYPWGNEWDEQNLINVNSWQLHEVGTDSLNVSPYGVFDMLGNAGEWVNDWFTEDYYARSPYRNPQGAAESDQWIKIFRSPQAVSRMRWGLTARSGNTKDALTIPGVRCAYSEEK